MRKTLAAILLLPALALAQTSFQTIGYQGLLKKSDGTPETQTVQVTFRIFAASTGGTELWSEVQNVTPNSGGFYAVFLGSKNAFPSTLFDGSDRYLELQIQGDSTALTPRQQIGSVPYALTAKNVNGGTTGTVTTGSVNASSVTVSGAISVPTPTAAEHAARMDMAGQNGMVTRAKLATVGQQESNPIFGTFSTTSTGVVDVPNLSVTITTTGRPVMIMMISSFSPTSAYYTNCETAGTFGDSWTQFYIYRDSTVIANYEMTGNSKESRPIVHLDVPPAGVYIYKIRVSAGSTGGIYIRGYKLVAYEL